MAWTYSGDPKASLLDRYRFYIGDTIAGDPILMDDEIEFIIEEYSAHNFRMYKLFEQVCNKFNRDIKRSLGPQSEDPTSRAAYFQKQYERYQSLAESLSGYPSLGPQYSGRAFREGLHDNV